MRNISDTFNARIRILVHDFAHATFPESARFDLSVSIIATPIQIKVAN